MREDDSDATDQRSLNLMIEQSEIIDNINNIRDMFRGRGFSWNRFRGNAINNIIAHNLENHLPKDIKLVKLAWVEDCATEFDLIIVSRNAEPSGFTDAYDKDQVKLVIEIKASGVFFKSEEVKTRLTGLFEKWKKETQKPALYLSVWEAKAHAKIIQEALGNDTAFLLQIEGDEPTLYEWERFLDRVDTLLKTNQ